MYGGRGAVGMKARLAPALDFYFDLEGDGRVHKVAGDPGGRTVWGVAENYHPEMWSNGPPTREAAEAFYRRKWWEPLRLGELDNQEVADEIFEFSCNATTPRRGTPNPVIRIAQESVNDVRWRTGQPLVMVDGLVGIQTLAALNALGIQTLEALAWDARFNLRQLDYYRTRRKDLVDRFFHGWSRRVVA